MNFNIYNNTAGNCSLLSASIWIPNDLEHYSLLSLQKIIDINKFEYSVFFVWMWQHCWKLISFMSLCVNQDALGFCFLFVVFAENVLGYDKVAWGAHR